MSDNQKQPAEKSEDHSGESSSEESALPSESEQRAAIGNIWSEKRDPIREGYRPLKESVNSDSEHYWQLVGKKPLGQGGLGVVWKANNIKTGEEGVFKFVKGLSNVDALRNEMNKFASLKGAPGIVPLREYLKATTPCLFSDFVNGMDFHKVLKKRFKADGPVSPVCAVSFSAMFASIEERSRSGERI